MNLWRLASYLALRLTPVLFAAAVPLVIAGLWIASVSPRASQAGGATNGAMAVDCDADTVGVQTECTYGPGENFNVNVDILEAPSPGGFFGAQVKLRWTNGLVDYQPRQNLKDEAIWPRCDIPARVDNRPDDLSLVYACLPFPLPSQGSTYQGTMARFAFQCMTTPASNPIRLSAMSPPADGPNEVHLSLVARDKDPIQLGTLFVDSSLDPIDPELTGAAITCQGDPPPTPPTPSPPPPGPGIFAVDCDAALAGIQDTCVHSPLSSFFVQIHVVQPPGDGYFGFQVKLRWPDGSLEYSPAADSRNEAPWQDCAVPARHINEPNDPSVVFGCVPFPLPAQPLTKTGALVQFQMQCNALAALDIAAPTSPSQPNLVLVPRPGDTQLGTHFLNNQLAPVDPDLRGATVDCFADADGDGCLNELELGPDPLVGGGRNPDNFWDFFDTPGAGNLRDGAISSADIARLVQRFGTNDLGTGAFNRQSNPLTAPSPPIAPSSARQNYHPAFDRSSSLTKVSGPADGVIPAGDIALLVAQFGHTCIPPED